ncbi:hypothetical protein [Aeoliella sp. SH292]|uniref:hypothetical protein n=1 Tax=Aeoliella sp. SH292 TaxID=3454464 RepID=UPI003F99A83C
MDAANSIKARRGWIPLLITAAFLMSAGTAIAQETEPGDTCAGFATGSFRQSAGDGTIGHILICDGTNWQPLLSHNSDGEATTIGNQSCGTGQVLTFNGTIWACAAAGGGSGIWEAVSGVVRPVSGVVNYATDDFVFGSNQIDNVGAQSYDDTRMFFDTSKSAFRAGYAQSHAFNDANVGNFSAAFGTMNIASGAGSFSVGEQNHATGQNSFAGGAGAIASGSTYSSLAFGDRVTASGNNSTAFGQEARATGSNSFTIGLSDQTNTDGNRPQVSGAGSFGVFMSQADSFNLTGSKVFAVVGGRGLIDPAFTQVDVSTGTGGKLALDVEGPIGGTHFCDEGGNNCFTAADASGLFSGSSGLWRASGGDVIYYSSGTPQVGIGNSSPTVALDVTGSSKISSTLTVGGGTPATGYSSCTTTRF